MANWAGKSAVLVTIAGTASFFSSAFAADNPPTDTIFKNRLQSYMAGGYDPLTTPTDWFAPTEKLEGGNLPDPLVATPTRRTIPDGALEVAKAYAISKDSMALIVVRGDHIELEYYDQGVGRDTRFNPQSMSKTLLALAVGAAVRDGYIQSVDDRIDRYFSYLKDDPRGAITVKNLLQMSGGLAQISSSMEVSAENPAVRQHLGSDFIEPILGLELVDPPGARWDYNNNETTLLGHLLTVATSRRYVTWLAETIWQPLGLRDADMYLDRPGGSVMMSCCILSRPMDFLRIGMMLRDKGQYAGRQIVPASWIDQMITPAETSDGYGYQTWLGDRNVEADFPADVSPNYSWASEQYVAKDTFQMNGFGFQRVWVVPSRDLVILRAGRTWPAKWDESAIPNTIVRAIDSVEGMQK